MIGKSRGSLKPRRGQGLVEFVLVAPMLLLLIFGLIEFARAWHIRHTLTDAAREGARWMAVRYDTAGANQAIANALGTASLSVSTVTVTFSAVTTPTGSATQVSIQYPHTLGVVGNLLSWALPQSQLNIHSVVTMRNE